MGSLPLIARPLFSAVGLQGSFSSYTVGTSAQQILGPNSSRIALTFASAGNPLSISSASQIAASQLVKGIVNNAANQTLLTYTCPANTSAFVSYVVVRTTSGSSPSVLCQWTRGANTMQLTGTISQGSPQFIQWYLSAADVCFLQASGSASNGTLDLGMSVLQLAGGGAGGTTAYLNIGFQNGLVIGNGFPIYQNTVPIMIDYSMVGAAIFGNVYAISSSGNVNLSVIETFLTAGLNPATAVQLAMSP